jgi:hemin uptake protein HemP
MRSSQFYSLTANEKHSYLEVQMAATHIDKPTPLAASTSPQPERVVSTRDLLSGARRIWIEHAAERYLLQVTRSGKLILTK